MLIPIKYLTPRVKKMLHRRDLNKKQVKAAAEFGYLYSVQFMIRGPGTNFVKNSKIDQVVSKGYSSRMGLSFPIHRLGAINIKTLEEFLVRDTSFVNIALMLGKAGEKRTLHRLGIRAVKKSLDAFNQLVKDS